MIAAGPTGIGSETQSVRKDGRRSFVEFNRRAMLVDGKRRPSHDREQLRCTLERWLNEAVAQAAEA